MIPIAVIVVLLLIGLRSLMRWEHRRFLREFQEW